jgi:poly(A) polymerase
MVQNHLRPGQMSQGLDLPTPRAIHRFFRDVSGAAVDTLYLSFADYLAARGPSLEEADWHRHASKVSHILEQRTRPEVDPGRAPLVNGHDLMDAFGLAPSPRIGQLLEEVHEAEAAGDVTSHDEALAWVARMLGTDSDAKPVTIAGARRSEA